MKVFLIGMMGSGKSYWMERLSARLKMAGYDLDTLIEEHEGRTIKQIFKESGEEYFRKIETEILRTFSAKYDFILATGGGAPCFDDNIQWMNSQGITIWLDEPVDALVERLIPEKAHRPLISHLSNDEMRSYLEEKKKEREPFYRQAKYTLNAHELTEENLLAILKQEDHA